MEIQKIKYLKLTLLMLGLLGLPPPQNYFPVLPPAYLNKKIYGRILFSWLPIFVRIKRETFKVFVETYLLLLKLKFKVSLLTISIVNEGSTNPYLPTSMYIVKHSIRFIYFVCSLNLIIQLVTQPCKARFSLWVVPNETTFYYTS